MSRTPTYLRLRDSRNPLPLPLPLFHIFTVCDDLSTSVQSFSLSHFKNQIPLLSECLVSEDDISNFTYAISPLVALTSNPEFPLLVRVNALSVFDFVVTLTGS
jgi:hypothetical protein